jgi:hypothetical protein
MTGNILQSGEGKGYKKNINVGLPKKKKETKKEKEKRSKPVASRARIASQNALAFSRRRRTSLAEFGMAESWKSLDKRCMSC